MVRLTRPLEDADLALMNGAGGHLMAALWKDGNGDATLAPMQGDAYKEDVAAQGVLTAPFDVVAYAGPVTVDGYERLSDLLESQKRNRDVLLILETAGGDPDAAFRIARALGFHYQRVHALIPRYCKSAGTLIALGASALYMDDRSELGPLDMQFTRGDEIGAMSSRDRPQGGPFAVSEGVARAGTVPFHRESLWRLAVGRCPERASRRFSSILSL